MRLATPAAVVDSISAIAGGCTTTAGVRVSSQQASACAPLAHIQMLDHHDALRRGVARVELFRPALDAVQPAW